MQIGGGEVGQVDAVLWTKHGGLDEAGQGLPRERRLRQARASAPVLFRSVGFKLFVGAVSQRESLLKVYFKLNRCGSRVDNSQHVPTSKRTRIDQRERARSSPVNGDDN